MPKLAAASLVSPRPDCYRPARRAPAM